jgi:hypothetical protein
MASPKEMNDACVLIVRKIQEGAATEDDLLFLWRETCKYINRGIESWSYVSMQDPCMGTEDIRQDLYLRIPGWAKTFRPDMTCWGQWARSCWWRWIQNHAKHHARHRPKDWISIDIPYTGLYEPQNYITTIVINQANELTETYKEFAEIIDNGLFLRTNSKDEKGILFKVFLWNRIVLSLSLRNATPAGMSYEVCRKWESEIVDMWKKRM